jgi:hypothetical protein
MLVDLCLNATDYQLEAVEADRILDLDVTLTIFVRRPTGLHQVSDFQLLLCLEGKLRRIPRQSEKVQLMFI